MEVTLSWEGDLRFRAVGAAGIEIPLDGDTEAGVSPMETLLTALASCMGSDVVDILRKGRQELTAVSIRLAGDRREEAPRRFTAIRMTIDLEGRGLSRARAERAVELSRSTYCSVWSSLAPDIDFQVTLEVREAS
jgi:putative redox protein